jgi:conjugative relaxase-like TrwC/TraI family protein
MLSVAAVRLASGAANYFAKDDYYTVEGSSEISMWAGEGVSTLGLDGAVTKAGLEAILKGVLPDGEGVAQVENRRAGLDLTFSMPKSASVMAYVAGDKRILDANLAAVGKAMRWVETNLAQGRRDVEGRKVPVQTGNLVYALFQHDTSRALDPQSHIHAVVVNLTRMLDGKWQALHADKIWSHNSIIGSIYHAFLRFELERLGYQIESRGKHGTFEIVGVPKAVLSEFSQRREAIVERATQLGIRSPEGMREITKRTRDSKLDVEDRSALKQSWVDRALTHGFTGKEILSAALARSEYATSSFGMMGRGYRSIVEAVTAARERLGVLLGNPDPLVDHALARAARSPEEARAQLAVASAVRMLSEREAAWPLHLLAKTALDLGLKGVTVHHVEQRIGSLLENRQLIPGVAKAADRNGIMLTTVELLATEEKILRAVAAGKGMTTSILAPQEATERLRIVAAFPLNDGQLAAAAMILSGTDHTLVVQGNAGAGKSTMLEAVARVAEAERRGILGLAFQNKMVADLAKGAGIKAQTVASFLLAHERFISGADSTGLAKIREQFAGSMLIVDETSMVSSMDMLKLQRVSTALGIDRLVLVGDRQQLSSIDAGKAFAMIQAGGGTMARMDKNIRQRTQALRHVAALANIGHSSTAMRVLGDHVIEDGAPAEKAAEVWLALSPADREETALFASGRDARATINQRIQEGLVAEGTVNGPALALEVYERVNMTREELRYASSYQVGQTLEVGRGGGRDVGIAKGRYAVLKVHLNGKVELSDGRSRFRFDPQKLSPTERRDRLQLSETKRLSLHKGDQIRWTANDKKRDLYNAALARVLSVDRVGIMIETIAGDRHVLELGDPMLSRLDLAYSLNMHMAQGITTDKAIIVMFSTERNLTNQRLFNVGVTRVREELTMVVDDREKLARMLDINPGNKTSALETLGRLQIDRNASQVARKFDQSKGRVAGLSDLPPPGSSQTQQHVAARGEVMLPLPERSLGLDL